VAVAEFAYRYSSPSVLQDRDDGCELLLSTSGGATEAGAAAEPFFFSGFLTEPAVAARGMLACAAVARSRYIRDPEVTAAILDPVVTSNQDWLRFEAFSSCCGVHARLDLMPAALDVAPVASGRRTWISVTRCGRPWRGQRFAGRSYWALARTRWRWTLPPGR
jgi:hypothetical protein